MKKWIVIEMKPGPLYLSAGSIGDDKRSWHVFIWQAKLMSEKEATRIANRLRSSTVIVRPVSAWKIWLMKLIGSPLKKPLG